MDPESKKLLQDTFALEEENNKMLHSMRRSQRMASVFRFVYWFLIIASTVGAYYFIQPYFEQLTSFYGGASSIFNSFK